MTPPTPERTEPRPGTGAAIARFRLVAYAEAVTFLILLGGVVVKRVLNGSDVGVRVMGPIHGIVFLVYVVMVLQVRASQAWNLGQTLLVIVASALPFGGFFVGSHLSDEGVAREA
jgi:integral membrane protein